MAQFNFNNSAYLLGAGASCDAGMPAIGKLGELIREGIKAQKLENEIFLFAKRKIEEHKVEYKQYCGTYGDIDIEDVMSGVRVCPRIEIQAYYCSVLALLGNIGAGKKVEIVVLLHVCRKPPRRIWPI